jgi:aminoglycoside phosphotransferase family enzyme/predicted kinase
MFEPSSDPIVAGLLDPSAYPHATGQIRLVETHISWVFLTGSYVYKVKKPCALGFLDFSTLERRKRFCHEEVRVSGRFAPTIYLGAVPIGGSRARPVVGGVGPTVEWAVKLAQFDEADRLDNLFEHGRLTAADCERLGSEIATVQERLEVSRPGDGRGSPESVLDAAAINLAQLNELRPDVADQVERIGARLRQQLELARGLIERRIAAGRIRECHGDLHLANIVLHDGRMTAFDAIEFNESLRWIDVANDVAFLSMDLESRDRGDLAAHVTSSWMEGADDHAAAAVLPAYQVYRAVVRAAVAAIRTSQAGDSSGVEAATRHGRSETDRYLALAERLMLPARPMLVATCGVSGSGKTTLAGRLVGGCRAVRLRSDVERKRLAGMGPIERPVDAAATAALYADGTSRQVYRRLADLARTVLSAGRSVVIDAACNRRWQRDMLASAAKATGVPVVWLDLAMDPAEVVARVATRQKTGCDASDATAEVVREQMATREPLTPQEVAGGPPGRLVRIDRAALEDESFADRLAADLAATTFLSASSRSAVRERGSSSLPPA